MQQQQHHNVSSQLPQQIEWIEMPESLDKAKPKVKVEHEFLATNCLCGKHPAPTYVLASPHIVVMCTTQGACWLSKPANFNVEAFKKQMTTVQTQTEHEQLSQDQKEQEQLD